MRITEEVLTMSNNAPQNIQYTVGRGNNVKKVVIDLTIIDGKEVTQEDIVKSLTEYICAFEDIIKSCA